MGQINKAIKKIFDLYCFTDLITTEGDILQDAETFLFFYGFIYLPFVNVQSINDDK